MMVISKGQAKVKNQVEDIADDLIQTLFWAQSVEGFAFSAMMMKSNMLLMMLSLMLETDDQLRSVGKSREDMQASHPMDRLLVGMLVLEDWSCNATAFKAVNDHKQVVVLVPTTVLAQQHYTNFKERFQNFAVNIDVLSRFRSKKEQTETLEKIENGQVDILIGTHRVLSKDVVFSDLGLMIIDEEQRFGLSIKETLKELKTSRCSDLDSNANSSYPSHVYAGNSRFVCYWNSSN